MYEVITVFKDVRPEQAKLIESYLRKQKFTFEVYRKWKDSKYEMILYFKGLSVDEANEFEWYLARYRSKFEVHRYWSNGESPKNMS